MVMNMAKRRVGILGGTFDPIHIGHMIMAEQARDQYDMDEVILMPSGRSYFKDHREQKVLSAHERLAMTTLACEGQQGLSVSDMEIRRGGNTYTYETLQILKRENPDTEYFFIIGGDTLCAIPTWREPGILCSLCVIAATMREDQITAEAFAQGKEDLERKFGASVVPVSIPNIGISSTDIRRRILNRKTIHFLVPEGVERYIIEHELYRTNV